MAGPAIWSTTSMVADHKRLAKHLDELKDEVKKPKVAAWVNHVIKVAESRTKQ